MEARSNVKAYDEDLRASIAMEDNLKNGRK